MRDKDLPWKPVVKSGKVPWRGGTGPRHNHSAREWVGVNRCGLGGTAYLKDSWKGWGSFPLTENVFNV